MWRPSSEQSDVRREDDRRTIGLLVLAQHFVTAIGSLQRHLKDETIPGPIELGGAHHQDNRFVLGSYLLPLSGKRLVRQQGPLGLHASLRTEND